MFRINHQKAQSAAKFQTLSFKTLGAEVHKEMFQGREHLVVPIVALVEGVIQGAAAATPELALASEFGKFVEGWNGRPVTLDHPMRDNSYVSASSTPKVFEEEALGFLFNSEMDDKKLKTEAWIDLSRVAEASEEVKAEIKRLEDKEVVEVSTGLFAMVEQTGGKFNSEAFQGIWREVVPDHLAILSKGTKGACSIADGCGANRTNVKGLELNCEGKCTCQAGKEPTVLEKTVKGFKMLFGVQPKKPKTNLTHEDVEAALTAALSLEDNTCYHWIVSVSDGTFVYVKNWDSVFIQRKYAIANTGEISLSADSVRVRPVTEFVPVTVKEEVMTKEELINSLIANKALSFVACDKAWLTTLSEDQLKKLEPKAQETQTNTQAELDAEQAEKDKAAALAANAGKKEEPKVASTPDEYLAAAPSEVRDVLTEGLKMQRDRKASLIKDLKANKRNTFSEDELKAMGIKQLEGLAKLADLPSYEGRAGSSITANTEDSNAPVAPVQVFGAAKKE